MADEQQGRARRGAFFLEQGDEGVATVCIKRRGRLVRQDQPRLADQGAGGGDALLLADAEIGGALGPDRTGVKAQPFQQSARFSLFAACSFSLTRTLG
jgi:hypothetical protein